MEWVLSIYENLCQKYPNSLMHGAYAFYIRKFMSKISQRTKIGGADFLYGKIDMLICPKIRSQFLYRKIRIENVQSSAENFLYKEKVSPNIPNVSI